MIARRLARFTISGFVALSAFSAVGAASSPSDARIPVTVSSARVSIAGTSNIHDYTASTTNVRVVRLELAEAVGGPNVWDEIVKPGVIDSFEVAIAAGSLSSPREGIDKNMHKALKVSEFPVITFRLIRFDGGEPGLLHATGTLKIAGVEREIALNLTTERHDATFTVKGAVTLLMTDYGITPPKALMGVLKTNPKVTVTFETVLVIPFT